MILNTTWRRRAVWSTRINAFEVRNDHFGVLFLAGGDKAFLYGVGIATGLHDGTSLDQEFLIRKPGRIVESAGLSGKVKLGPGACEPLGFFWLNRVVPGSNLRG